MSTTTYGFLDVLAEEREKVLASNEALGTRIKALEHRIFLLQTPPIRWWELKKLRRRADLRAQIREIQWQEYPAISTLLNVVEHTEKAFRSGGPRHALGYLIEAKDFAYTQVSMCNASNEWGRKVMAGIEKLQSRLKRFEFT